MDQPLAGYQELEHTADWALRVWAPDLAGLLEQAARGMNELCGILLSSADRKQLVLRVEASDGEGLLVNYLAELLHFAESENLAFDTFGLTVAKSSLSARLEGGPILARSKEIKAVTYHDLQIRKVSDGLEVLIVFDV